MHKPSDFTHLSSPLHSCIWHELTYLLIHIQLNILIHIPSKDPSRYTFLAESLGLVHGNVH